MCGRVSGKSNGFLVYATHLIPYLPSSPLAFLRLQDCQELTDVERAIEIVINNFHCYAVKGRKECLTPGELKDLVGQRLPHLAKVRRRGPQHRGGRSNPGRRRKAGLLLIQVRRSAEEGEHVLLLPIRQRSYWHLQLGWASSSVSSPPSPSEDPKISPPLPLILKMGVESLEATFSL